MPRRNLIRTADFPYHVTNRSNNREFFYVEPEILWPIFIENLGKIQTKYECEIHAFVMMTNHYHLQISTPHENLEDAMCYFNREVARAGNKIAGRTNHFFGTRYKWSLIPTESYYWNATKYIFRNPVRAGICKSVQDYKFSSLNFSSSIVDWKTTDYFFDREKRVRLDLDWLNEPFANEQEAAIQKALRRTEFKLPKDRNGKMLTLQEIKLIRR